VAEIGFPLSCGIATRELADRLGEPTTWVNERIRELREELERLS
jgi:hypothetical protein